MKIFYAILAGVCLVASTISAILDNIDLATYFLVGTMYATYLSDTYKESK